MFKIGEFSKITQVSVRMLRYYDENKLLIPAKINMDTGYRMYSNSQIVILNRILFLKNLGFSVNEIRSFLENWDTENIKRTLTIQKSEIEQAIAKEHEKLLRLQAALSDLDREQIDLNTQIVIKKLPSYHVLSLRKIVSNYFCEGELWKELYEKIYNLNIEGAPSFSIYHDEEQNESGVDIEVCVVYDTASTHDKSIVYRKIEEVEKAACFIIYGAYENIAVAYKTIAYWLEQHPEYVMCGANRQICHKGEWNEANPENYITEMQIPIKINVYNYQKKHS